MSRIPTEYALENWRLGQPGAERMCAELLHMEGYSDVDPQCPLGGPDGLRDVVCVKDGRKWIVAAYFPSGPVAFRKVKTKFQSDLVGVDKNRANAFAFLVNQRLSPAQRSELASSASCLSEIYHLERIRSILDAPKGYGVRLEYLGIEMNKEEQLAFWSVLKSDIVRLLRENSVDLKEILMRTRSLTANLVLSPSSLVSRPRDVVALDFSTRSLSLEALCLLHRGVTENDDLPEQARGRLRTTQTWIGTKNRAVLTPPPPAEIEDRLTNLLNWWRNVYPELQTASRSDRIEALAKFHHWFVSIHPFLDANGRVGRLLLDHAGHELLNGKIGRKLIADAAAYLQALQAADRADSKPLVRLISACVE